MNELILSEIETVKEILDTVKNFVMNNNKSIIFTQYYISLGNKNLLQVIEETLSDPLIDEKQKKKHTDLMKTFLDKIYNLYSSLSDSTDPELIDIRRKIEQASKTFGFTSNNSDNVLLLELKNTLEKLEKKEIVL